MRGAFTPVFFPGIGWERTSPLGIGPGPFSLRATPFYLVGENSGEPYSPVWGVLTPGFGGFPPPPIIVFGGAS